jgi:hypothetical protein
VTSPFRPARRQHGLLTRRQLLDEGLSDAEIAALVRRGHLRWLHRGVYALAGAPDTLARRLLAASLALGTGFASHGAAASLLGLYRPPRAPRPAVHLTVPHGTSRTLAGTVLHRTRILPSSHRLVVDGVPTLTVERTVCDLAAMLDDDALARTIDEALARRRTTLDAVIATFETLDAGRRAGRGRLRRLLGERAHGSGLAESELEARFLALVRDAGLPAPVVQASPSWLPVPAGRVDCLYPAAGLVAELDGRGHLTEAQRDLDLRRDHAAQRHGWTVARFSWRQVVHDGPYVVDVMRSLLAKTDE